jgi:hypothetical protein
MGGLVSVAAEALVWTFDTYRVVFGGYYISELSELKDWGKERMAIGWL